MFKLDSDLLGILLALITFLFPVFSALAERRRKKRDGAPLPEQEEFPETGEEDLKGDVNEIFDMLFGKRDEVKDVDVREMPPVEEVPEDNDTVVPDRAWRDTVENPPLTVQPDTRQMQTESASGESDSGKGKGVKERLAKNPKDMVIFAEIMNPKYKEL